MTSLSSGNTDTLIVGEATESLAHLEALSTSSFGRDVLEESTLESLEESKAIGLPMGGFKMTYYFPVVETEFKKTKKKKKKLYEAKTCDVIDRVSKKFKAALDLEGSAILEDGRVVNYIGKCKCSKKSACYALAPDDAPYGLGSKSNALEPFRSVATDKKDIEKGTILYVKELDGLSMPMPYGFEHDGCVRADDNGGGVEGQHLDFFLPTKQTFRSGYKNLPQEVTVFDGGGKCDYLNDSGEV